VTATKAIWHPGVTLEFFNSIRPGTMPEYLEIVFTEVGPDYLKATMPVSERTCQPMRVLHGGASVVLAETLASTAGNATIDIGRHSLLGQEINANHLRPVPFGSLVTGVTRPVHIGARSQVWSTEIVDERGRLACISRMTLALVERPLRAAPGA
jgi:1,4-dihydroxy-2-naphthoyl-CoA hydrolase